MKQQELDEILRRGTELTPDTDHLSIEISATQLNGSCIKSPDSDKVYFVKKKRRNIKHLYFFLSPISNDNTLYLIQTLFMTYSCITILFPY